MSISAAVPELPAPSSRRREPAVRGVPVRRVVAFVVAVAVPSLAVAVALRVGLVSEDLVVLAVPLLQLVPLLAALLVRDRRVPLRRSLALSMPSRRATIGAIGLAVVVFTLVPGLRAVGGGVIGALEIQPPAQWAGILLAVPAVFLLQTAFAVGEELGWRGWLHGALRPAGFWRAAAVTAAVWAGWHAPVVLALGLRGWEAASYLLTIVAVAPLLAALREVGASVWPAVVGHGLFNSVRVALDQNVGLTSGSIAARVALDVLGWALWILAAAVVLALARRSAARA